MDGLPPVLLLYWTHDARWAACVAEAHLRFKLAGVPSPAVALRPTSLYPRYFANAGLEGVNNEVSAQLYTALAEAGLLQNGTSWLQHRTEHVEGVRYNLEEWRDAIRPVLAANGVPDALVADQSGVLEALDVVYGWHEIVTYAEATNAPGFTLTPTFLLRWLESGGQMELPPEIKEHQPRPAFGPLADPTRPVEVGDCKRFGLAMNGDGTFWGEINRGEEEEAYANGQPFRRDRNIG